MGKLFLIIYFHGQIGGVAGPLPYGLDECYRRAEELRVPQRAIIATGKTPDGARVLPARINDLKNMRFECEFRDKRPEIEVKD